jgi:arginine decarboxylase
MSRAEETRAFALSASMKRYGADRWGRDFLVCNDEGNLVFKAPGLYDVDLHKLATFVEKRGIRTPFVIRFPKMIERQMKTLHDAFAKAANEHQYRGGHVGVYPLKVNQRRAVVETVVNAREACQYGLEAGSKPELLIAMAQPVIPGHPIVCNGFKDREFMRMAFHAAELGHPVVIVLESLREVRRFIEVADETEWQASPTLGLRAKLYSRGSGRWQGSGGERAKFGLTTNEILAVERELREAGKIELLSLVHFHIGSQITQIKRIKTAVREGMRLWGALRQRCTGLRYIDLGGGIGVDYDGSKTSYPSSVNYSIEEYASQVVFEICEVANEMEVEHPTILTESGRVLVSNHAVMITDLREVQGDLHPVPEATEDESRLIMELRHTEEHISVKNIEEYFHDAVDYRDEALQLFSRGYLSLEERAAAEGLFHRIRLKCARLIEQMPTPPEEIVEYLKSPQHKYLANFSIFQSLPDTWSIGQVFPVAPLSRHSEKPDVNAQIVDITCDSDGCVNVFAHPDENLTYLPLMHRAMGSKERYYIGFFLVGAYQDSLANQHNLFSRCHEVIVHDMDDVQILRGSEMVDFDDETSLEIKGGLTNEDILALMDYDAESVISLLRDRHLEDSTTLGKPWALGLMSIYPYLSP